MSFEKHQPRKRFGQNFLHDERVIDNIIKAVSPQATDTLVEIGPGQGALTDALVANAKHITLIEIDRDLVEQLRQRYQHLDNVTIISQDVLTFDFATLARNGETLRIVGNLPYNISTPLIFHLLTYHKLISDMHFMLQKEVVERMASVPGEKSWGRLGIMTQYYTQAQFLFSVPPEAFSPAPKVESAIVRLQPYSDIPVKADNEKMLATVVRTAFNQRRKTLRNALKPLIKDLSSTELESATGIDMGLRPEMLSLTNFIHLSNQISLLIEPQ